MYRGQDEVHETTSANGVVVSRGLKSFADGMDQWITPILKRQYGQRFSGAEWRPLRVRCQDVGHEEHECYRMAYDASIGTGRRIFTWTYDLNDGVTVASDSDTVALERLR